MTENEIYQNRAEVKQNGSGQVEGIDHTLCPACEETMVFAMRDKYHEFSIGLSTVLECLRAAEAEGYVPPLPAEWWFAIQ